MSKKNITSTRKKSHIALITILGVSIFTVPFAEAKTNPSEFEPFNVKASLQVRQVASLPTSPLTLENTQAVTYNDLMTTIKTDITKPEPSFEAESNTQLLVQATILNTEADMLTDRMTTLSTNIESELADLKAQVEKKKEEERAERLLEELKQTNPASEIIVTTSWDDFIASAKQHQFVNYDARTPSNLTAEELDLFVEGTQLEGLGNAYAQAEKDYGVSAFVLLALSAHESAWGKSRIAQDKNNLFGYMAYDNSPYASAKHFETKDEAVLTVANHLATNYLTQGAKYFNGYTLEAMNVRYASDKEWNAKITNIMNRLIDKF